MQNNYKLLTKEFFKFPSEINTFENSSKLNETGNFFPRKNINNNFNNYETENFLYSPSISNNKIEFEVTENSQEFKNNQNIKEKADLNNKSIIENSEYENYVI